MSERKKVQRSGRNIQLTLDELFESPRFKIAVSMFEHDPMFLRAIFTELYLETVGVVKSKLIKTFNLYSDLDNFELIPLLRSVNDFDTFNIWWSLSPLETELYLGDIKNQMTSEQKQDLLKRITTKFMESGNTIAVSESGQPTEPS